MLQTTELVTLRFSGPNGEVEERSVSPDTELSLHEVAHYTGYNEMVLRRLDKDNRIPRAHRGLVNQPAETRGISRYWFAHEIAGILDYKAKAQKGIVARAGKLHKLANAARRKAKKDAREAAV